MKNHGWALNSTGAPVAPADVKATFEALRDHYSNTALVAGKDPRDNKTLLKFQGFEDVEAQMDRAIAALVAVTAGMTKPVHATLRGMLRKETDRKPGDQITISVSVAQEGAGPEGVDGFEDL